MRVSYFYGSVAEIVSYDDMEGSVFSADSFASDFTGDVTSNDALDLVVQPRGMIQVVAMRVNVAGAEVPPSLMSGPLNVTRDYNSLLQSWSFMVAMEDPDGIFGAPFSCIGPAIGLGEVDTYGVYATPSAVIQIPLIKDGIVDNSTRSAGEDGLHEVFSGVDRGGRFDGKKVTIQFPPGHGLSRDLVGREIMKRLEEFNVDFKPCNRMDKELQMVDTEPLPTLAEIFEVENKKLLWSSDGYVTNPQAGVPLGTERIAFSFDERDVLRVNTVSLDSSASVITLVVANGTQQVATPQEPCETRTEHIIESNYETNYVVKRSAFQQVRTLEAIPATTDEWYVPVYNALTAASPSAGPVLTRRKEITRKYICDVLVEEIVLTYAYARREVTRFEWYYYVVTDPPGSPDQFYWAPLNCFTDDESGVGGGPAYADEYEQFRLVEASITRNFYLEERFVNRAQGDWERFLVIQDMRFGRPGWNQESPLYGQAQGTVTWYARLGHIKTTIKTDFGNPISPWWLVDPPFPGAEIWGDGSGFNDYYSADVLGGIGFVSPVQTSSPQRVDAMLPWSISVTGLHGTSDQFLDKEVEAQYGWGVNRGARYYFQEGDIRSGPSEEFVVLSSNVTNYSVQGTTHTEVSTRTDGLTGTQYTDSTSGLAGGLPSIERLDFVEINPDIYEDGEVTTEDPDTGEIIPGLDMKAKRGDTKQLTVTVPFDFFLTCHPKREVVVEFPWAENETELQDMAEALSQESAAMTVNFTLPANFLIREGDVIHFTYRPLKIDHDMRVSSVRWEQTVGGPILTSVSCKLYAY